MKMIVALVMALFILITSSSLFAEEMKTITLDVEGMTCDLCAVAVEKSLKKIDGVKKAEASYKEGKAIVEYDEAKTNPQALLKAIIKVGYKARL